MTQTTHEHATAGVPSAAVVSSAVAIANAANAWASQFAQTQKALQTLANSNAKAFAAITEQAKGLQRLAVQMQEQEAREVLALIAQSDALREDVANALTEAERRGVARLALMALQGHRFALVRLTWKAAKGDRFSRQLLALAHRLRVHLRRVRLHVARVWLVIRALVALVRIASVGIAARRHPQAPPRSVILLGTVAPCAP